MLPGLQAVAFIPLVVVARLRRVEQRTIARLKDAGANTAERAVVMERAGVISGFVHRRLERAGAIQSAANDRYYLNEAAYTVFEGRRRRRRDVVLVILAIGFLVMFYRGEFR